MKRNYGTKSKMSLFHSSVLRSSNSTSSKGTTPSDDSRTDDTEEHDDDEAYTSEDEDFDDDDSLPEGILMNRENNAVKWVIGNEAYCFDVAKFSGKLVDATYIEARKQLYAKNKSYTHFDIVIPILMDLVYKVVHLKENRATAHMEHYHGSDSSLSFNLSSRSREAWPKISEFNIKLGLERVEDYVKTWERLEDWMFCVEFLGFECEDCSNVFVYEVEWSKPSKSYPIPQATASVYFALEVFKMVPFHYDRVIEVTYVFETTNVIHSPGRIDFQEKWLQDIIDSKVRFFRTVTFGAQVELARGNHSFSLIRGSVSTSEDVFCSHKSVGLAFR